MTGSNTNRALLKFMQYMLGLAFFICISLPASFSQNTLYDQLPNLDPMHKPAWSDDFPLWVKMLYQDHVNFYEIEQLFQRDTSKYKEKCPILRYYKQWSLALMGYVHDDGEIILPPISMIHNNLKFAREKSFSQLRNQDSVWRFVGPKETFWLNNDGDPEEPAACSWQVNVYAFDVAKSNPNILYAGTETGFVNKSTNRGMDWQQMGRSYNFGGAVTAVAIHPFNPDTVYIGAGGYVHTSTDGGKTWKSVPVIINGSITKILIHPSQTGKLICAGSKGIFISEDSGDNWSQVTSSKVWDIEFRPDDPSIIYAITLSFESYQLLVSVNAGASFEQVDGFPTNITESSGGLLAVCDSDPDLL